MRSAILHTCQGLKHTALTRARRTGFYEMRWTGGSGSPRPSSPYVQLQLNGLGARS